VNNGSTRLVNSILPEFLYPFAAFPKTMLKPGLPAVVKVTTKAGSASFNVKLVRIQQQG